MKKNKYKEIATNSRNKKYELKSKLTLLAEGAKNRINKNKTLRELISIEKNKISLNKQEFLKYSTLKLMSKNNQELSASIKKEINKNNSNVHLENDSLKRMINALKIKYDSLISKGREVSENVFNDLEKEKNKKFLIKNAIKQKECDFKDITQNLNRIKSESQKLEVDLAIYYEKEIEDDFDIKDELKKCLEIHTILFDQKLMQINKYLLDTVKKSKIINQLKLLKKSIKKYTRTLNNLLSNFNYLSFPNDKEIIIEGEECLRETNYNEGGNAVNNNTISFTEESESFLNETDINLEIKEIDLFRNNYLEEKSRLITKSLPKLDLTLINFNKQKLIYDYDEKSLSRKDMNHGITTLRIIKLKDEIKALNDKNDKLLEKIKKYAEKINKLNNIIININYQSPNTFRIKGVKKRKFLFSSPSVNSVNTNPSRNSKSISYRPDISRNIKNKLNLNSND